MINIKQTFDMKAGLFARGQFARGQFAYGQFDHKYYFNAKNLFN